MSTRSRLAIFAIAVAAVVGGGAAAGAVFGPFGAGDPAGSTSIPAGHVMTGSG